MNKEIELIVGRNNTSDIEINNDLVSGRHLRILKINSTVFVEDLGSTNGTTLDGELLSKGIKKIITRDSNILLAKKILLDLNHYKIQSLEVPSSVYPLDLDETEGDNMFTEDTPSFSLTPSPKPKTKEKWFLISILVLILLSITTCLSGKVDSLCEQLIGKDELKVEIPKPVKEYIIIAPKFMGSSKSNSSVLFANKTDHIINVKLIDIAIEGIPYDGIVVPLNGKGKFIVYGNDSYEYKLIFEESVTKDLNRGKYLCKVIFKVTIDGKKPKMESITFPIEIVNQ
jgi:pSer/pThr/pTyr-binding forkhead associated (FHA) protein